jgi:hypothetical protein
MGINASLKHVAMIVAVLASPVLASAQQATSDGAALIGRAPWLLTGVDVRTDCSHTSLPGPVETDPHRAPGYRVGEHIEEKGPVGEGGEWRADTRQGPHWRDAKERAPRERQ